MSQPYCLAMVLCDAVHQDRATGKFTLLGLFSTVGAHEFPADVQLCVYFAITDGDGDHQVTLRVVQSEHIFDSACEPVYEANVNVKLESPLMVLEGHFGIKDLKLPDPGVYHIELLDGDEVLMSRRLVALLHKTTGETDE